MKQEEKNLYKLIAQRDGITITATTTNEMTYDEAKAFALSSALGQIDKKLPYDSIVILPITTKERWEDGSINYCPRCAANLQDCEYEQYAQVYCHDCGAEIEIQILHIENDEE